MKKEVNNSHTFLDTTISKINNKFDFKLYRTHCKFKISIKNQTLVHTLFRRFEVKLTFHALK